MQVFVNNVIQVMFRKFRKFAPSLRFSLRNDKTDVIQKRFAATRKRFYAKANVLYNEGKFEVTLDQRKLKTPKGNLFYVESEPLALAVAAEWDAQKELIQSSTMHLTGLCNTVIDNPNNLTKYDIAHQIVSYLDTDTILFTSDEDGELYELQQKEWLPIVEWFSKRYGVDIKTTRDIAGPVITPTTKEVLTKHLMSYNIWAIHGYCFAIEALRSVILGFTCADRHSDVVKAVALSRLEEEYQSRRWGRIEWAHELNRQDMQARVAAGILFILVNSSSTLLRNKAELL